jgi:hypothetical protein
MGSAANGLVVRALRELRPEWLSTGHRRYGMGVRFLCPGHPEANHTVEVWFHNPCDGDGPLTSQEMRALGVRQLFRRIGGDLDELTLTRPGDVTGAPLELDEHWTGYVLEGEVYDAPEHI